MFCPCRGQKVVHQDISGRPVIVLALKRQHTYGYASTAVVTLSLSLATQPTWLIRDVEVASCLPGSAKAASWIFM